MNATTNIKDRHESNKKLNSIAAQLKELNKQIDILNQKIK